MRRYYEERRQRDREAILRALRAFGGEAQMGKLCRESALTIMRVKLLLKDLIAQRLVETGGNYPQVRYKLKEQ